MPRLERAKSDELHPASLAVREVFGVGLVAAGVHLHHRRGVLTAADHHE
jgi:hypothetical protein